MAFALAVVSILIPFFLPFNLQNLFYPNKIIDDTITNKISRIFVVTHISCTFSNTSVSLLKICDI